MKVEKILFHQNIFSKFVIPLKNFYSFYNFSNRIIMNNFDSSISSELAVEIVVGSQRNQNPQDYKKKMIVPFWLNIIKSRWLLKSAKMNILYSSDYCAWDINKKYSLPTPAVYWNIWLILLLKCSSDLTISRQKIQVPLVIILSITKHIIIHNIDKRMYQWHVSDCPSGLSHTMRATSASILLDIIVPVILIFYLVASRDPQSQHFFNYV